MIVVRETALLPRPPHEDIDFGQPVWLGDVVVRAELHRGDRGIDRAVPRDDDALRRRRVFANLAQDFEAVELRHHDVEQRNIERLRVQRVERGAPVERDRHPVAATREVALQEFAKIRLVFRHEDADRLVAGHRCSTVGSSTRKVLPWPSALSTSMRPLCSWMMP